MKKIAVILSGCGVYDGAEIHEATLSLLAIAKAGAGYQIFAPDIPQHHVVNHLKPLRPRIKIIDHRYIQKKIAEGRRIVL